jgi:hypothetical protein
MMDRNPAKRISMRKLSEDEMWILIVTLCRDPLQKSIDVGSLQRRRAILWADRKIKNNRK